MMRYVENPPNPYLGQHLEWLGEPPKAEVQVYEEQAKTILTHNESPDVDFSWSVNPYRGCFHACAYCYARPSHEYLGFGAGSDFENRIVVKTNAPELLRRELLRRQWQGELIAFSGDTDCYQPLESCWKLTRQCLEICAEFRNPIGVVTKSLLVQRDIDLFQEMNRIGYVHVLFSVAFSDDEMSRKLEPNAPLPSRRFNAMKALSDAGICTGLLLAPIIPGLNDRQIPQILQRAKHSGAKTCGRILLRLPGSVQPVFLDRVRKEFPLKAGRVEARLRDTRDGKLSDPRFFHRHHGTGEYWNEIEQLFQVWRRRLDLDQPLKGPEKSPFRRPGPRQLGLFDG